MEKKERGGKSILIKGRKDEDSVGMLSPEEDNYCICWLSEKARIKGKSK